uniref:phage tail protein n=1 Tax=Yersinia alsatica TaxID=2890317 RepID=UPI00119CF1A9
MDRQIVYPGAIPLETDLLNTNRYAMIGIAKLAATIMGTNTYLRGLSCTASSPASMTVNIARGEIYSLQNIDNTAYSSLPADTVNTILKQGVILLSTPFTLTAPTTAGQSINYLIQVTYQDIDTGATVLPYYNAANPSQAYSGPNNSGVAQYTARTGVCVISLKSGVAAITGAQTTPAVDSGYTAAWVITVAQGATTITAANIFVAPNAPFIPTSGIVDGIQRNTMTFALDTGTANAYVASYLPNLATISDGVRLTFKAKTANTGASTFAPNGAASAPIYSHANQALQGGEIAANGLVEVEWNSTNAAWILCGNSGGATPVLAGTQSNHAVNLGQLTSYLKTSNNLSEIAAAGSPSVISALTNLKLTESTDGYVGRLVRVTTFPTSGTVTFNTNTKQV